MPTKLQKAEFVKRIKEALGKYPVVAVATLQSLPSRQYNAIKKKLRGKAEIIVARSTLFKRAIDEGRKEVADLEKHFTGSTALLFTNQDPFQLAKTLKGSRSKTAAKPGQIAPADLVVPAGETNLPPGPVLTELKQAGLVAKIAGGKVVIDRDATVAKKGEPISANAAKVLAKLGIEPIEVGLKLMAAFDKGIIYSGEALDVDETAFIEKLTLAHTYAVNLAVQAEIYNATSMPLLITKAAREARAVEAATGAKPEEKSAEAAPAGEAPAAQAPAEAPTQA
jgi:large subunit ribosomal protein L10